MAVLNPDIFKKKKSGDFLGFDLNDDTLKIVHVRNTRLKREVSHLLTQPVHGMTDDDVAAFIRKAVDELKLKAARIYLSVPLHTVITRTIEIPSRDPREIREIVNLQASRHTPYSRSEIILDTLTIGVMRDNYTRVLLVIAPRDIVIRQTRLLEKAGLGLGRIFFSPEAIGLACTKILPAQGPNTSLAIVHMDELFTSFVVTQANQLLFVRGIPVGANHLLEEKEAYADRFVDELQKSLESYLSDESGPKPSLLLLTGVAAETNQLDDLFSETTHIPIKHQTYFNYFAISDEARAVAASSQHISFFNVIAPLLLFDKIKIDLVTEETKLKRDLESRGREMMKTGILALVLLFIVFLILIEQLYIKGEYLKNLTSRYNPVKEEAKGLEQLFMKTQIVKEYLSGRGASMEALAALCEALPPDTYLSEIKYDGVDKFSIKGTSKARTSSLDFVSQLEESPIFKNVTRKYSTTREEAGRSVSDFEITALMENKGQ
ncbi:MAG: hypothetical protein A3C47_05490 [Omnitrophica bacterium RIFCSPHIGHO2_02_FULL_51_18]|nr:MAG: hypothetical protein A3C47_05490 [Omnitrophica bacterium RIFCSPHIGHO2_02_FULL_51_18]